MAWDGFSRELCYFLGILDIFPGVIQDGNNGNLRRTFILEKCWSKSRGNPRWDGESGFPGKAWEIQQISVVPGRIRKNPGKVPEKSWKNPGKNQERQVPRWCCFRRKIPALFHWIRRCQGHLGMYFPGIFKPCLKFRTVFQVKNLYPRKLMEQIPWEALGRMGGADSLETFQGFGDFGNIGVVGAAGAVQRSEFQDFWEEF